jgi:hypothetical protein
MDEAGTTMSNRNKGWKRREAMGAETWYVFENNWQHAIKGRSGSYRLPGSRGPFKTLAEAKDEALRRIASAKPQLVRYVQGIK